MRRLSSTLNLLEVQALGASLRRIDPRLVMTPESPNTIRLWYQGGEPYFDLFVEQTGSEIEWIQFTLRGQCLSWNRQQSQWISGYTNEFQVDDLWFYPASKLIKTEAQINQGLMQIMAAILQTRRDEPVFEQILQLLPIPDLQEIDPASVVSDLNS